MPLPKIPRHKMNALLPEGPIMAVAVTTVAAAALGMHSGPQKTGPDGCTKGDYLNQPTERTPETIAAFVHDAARLVIKGCHPGLVQQYDGQHTLAGSHTFIPTYVTEWRQYDHGTSGKLVFDMIAVTTQPSSAAHSWDSAIQVFTQLQAQGKLYGTSIAENIDGSWSVGDMSSFPDNAAPTIDRAVQYSANAAPTSTDFEGGSPQPLGVPADALGQTILTWTAQVLATSSEAQ